LVSGLDAVMILLNPVVEVTISPMPHGFAELCPNRPWIAVMPVGRHPGRRDAGVRWVERKNAVAAAMSSVSLSLTSISAPELSMAR
jgi:hypothetical protein